MLLRGTRHSDFEDGKGGLVGNCYDFEAACEQYTMADQDEVAGVIAIEDPNTDAGLLYCRVDSLPFGALGRVVQFNRAAAAASSGSWRYQ